MAPQLESRRARKYRENLIPCRIGGPVERGAALEAKPHIRSD